MPPTSCVPVLHRPGLEPEQRRLGGVTVLEGLGTDPEERGPTEVPSRVAPARVGGTEPLLPQLKRWPQATQRRGLQENWSTGTLEQLPGGQVCLSHLCHIYKYIYVFLLMC